MDCSTFAFDLHVLGTPPALILSQDQTLKLKLFSTSAPRREGGRTRLTRSLLIGSRIPAFALALARATAGKPTIAPKEPRWVVKFASLALTRMRELRRGADTRRASDSAPLRTRRRKDICACTFYLVFKEPRTPCGATPLSAARPSLGEPSNCMTAQMPCQPETALNPGTDAPPIRPLTSRGLQSRRPRMSSRRALSQEGTCVAARTVNPRPLTP